MAFEQSTRNRLQKFVADARNLLTEEFTRQMQNDYGINPSNGTIDDLSELPNLDDTRRETARILRETLEHYAATSPSASQSDLLDRIVREQAFTVLNRLAALRMAEARGFLIESLGSGYSSQGFQLYQKVAGTGLGEIGDIYRTYIFSLFDEFSLDLKVLFDRFSPFGRLFPREKALLELLELMNHFEVAPLWAEDETVGWIYQYFNSKDERKKMRDESSAPRNSRELAVRNQFFTPRYVVEFLTDNTLGRTWYEMTKGKTSLAENCRYLVRRPKEIFLGAYIYENHSAKWYRDALSGDFSYLPEHPSLDEIGQFALLIDGYSLSEKHQKGDVLEFASNHMEAFTEGGIDFPNDSFELWLILFAYQRGYLKDGTYGQEDSDPILKAIRRVYEKLRDKLQNPSENLSQEEILKQPVYIPHRLIKDPREILMLDPACGSMHFGLYAFDLFLKIYEESWDLPVFPTLTGGLKSLRETYENNKDAFLRDVPRLIIEHNIHGVDIDPRAVQIAGLSLWLRAQRAWSEQNVNPLERPQIRRSNIVCAEPMPGEIDLLEEFITKHFSDTPEKRLLGEFVRRIFDSMKLAGEAGSLLKIEEEVAGLIKESQEQWRKLQDNKESFLFEGARVNVQPDFDFEVGGITDENFWNRAESEIYKALRRYSEAGEDGAGYGRRLFADDAAQGFAFIDLCRKRYDVILMNPPFGEFTGKTKVFAEYNFPSTKNDIYGAFIERTASIIVKNGYVGAITPRTWMALTRFEGLREIILEKLNLEYVIDLGYDVLESMAEVAVFIISHRNSSKITAFLAGFTSKDKLSKVEQIVEELMSHKLREVLVTSISHFNEVPQKIFAFGLPIPVLNAISSDQTLQSSGLFSVKQGIATGDNNRFLRALTEIPISSTNRSWMPYAKGGDFGLFYTPLELAVNWKADGYEIKTRAAAEYGSSSRTIKNESSFFLKGLTFSLVSQSGFSVRALPAGCIYDMGGPSIFQEDIDSSLSLSAMLCLLNSSFSQYCLSFLTDSRHWHVITIQSLPVWKLSDVEASELTKLGKICSSRLADVSSKNELDGRFTFPFFPTFFISIEQSTQQAIDNILELRNFVSECIEYVDDLSEFVSNVVEMNL